MHDTLLNKIHSRIVVLQTQNSGKNNLAIYLGRKELIQIQKETRDNWNFITIKQGKLEKLFDIKIIEVYEETHLNVCLFVTTEYFSEDNTPKLPVRDERNKMILNYR